VAVTTQGILILDSEGRRVLRAAKKGKVIEVAARLAVPDASSLAPATETSAYAAFDRGLLRIDLTARAMTVVEANDRIDLSGLEWIRYYRGSLVAIQKGSDETLRLVRIHLDDAGRTARKVDVLDSSVALGGPTSATISGSTLYYLGKTVGKDELEVKKLVLK
jgi:hypothetical protein